LALWLVQASWSPSLARADLIGINFKGPTKPETGASVGDRTAGVEPQSNWNDLGYWGSSSIKNDSGTGVANLSVNTSTSTDGYNSYTTIPSDDGNRYLMRGYIHSSGASMTVTVAGLGHPFTTHGYDVIVYFDGENGESGGADWITAYTITGGDITTVIYGKDEGGAGDWAGTFTEASGTSAEDANAVGNYVRFDGMKASAFTLTATPVSGDGPINAIQIIAAPEPASLALLVLGLSAALGTRLRRFRRRC
jgi:hypothetical protein